MRPSASSDASAARFVAVAGLFQYLLRPAPPDPMPVGPSLRRRVISSTKAATFLRGPAPSSSASTAAWVNAVQAEIFLFIDDSRLCDRRWCRRSRAPAR